MSAGVRPTRSLPLKLLVLIVAPALLAGGLRLASRVARSAPSGPDALDSLEQTLTGAFAELLRKSQAVAVDALASSPERARSALADPALADRLEGVGIADAAGHYVDWVGTPVEPVSRGDGPQAAAFSVRVDGVRTRLVTRAGPDGRGRLAVASFILDSTLGDLPFLALLPQELQREAELEVAFVDSATARTGERPRPSGRIAALRAPDGSLLGEATFGLADHVHHAAVLREVSVAWAALLLVLLLAVLFDWGSLCARRYGPLLALAALGLGRALLVWVGVPALLLPRAIGSPSLYGSSELGGALASPADLLLTAAALYLACSAVRRHCRARAATEPRFTLALAGVAAIGATAAAAALTISIGRNARMSLLDRPALVQWNGEVLVWVGLGGALLGAATLLGTTWALARGRRRDPGGALLPTALALVLLSFASSAALQRIGEAGALDQLSSQYAPHILEQSARRQIALLAALAEIRDKYQRGEVPEELLRAKPDLLAYQFWIDGELYHSGYKSSLSFYTPLGDVVSRFVFDLPPLDEGPPTADAGLAPDSPAGERLGFKRETFDQVSAESHLLHAEMPIESGGQRIGVVVGHVLDEPDNLPFLPWSRPYLAALGPGAPRNTGEEFADGPHYVLYDAYGTVVLTTLLQPPAENAALREAGGHRGRVRVHAGGEPYVGLALGESAGGLHLLLLPARDALERVSAAARLALLGLLLLALVNLLPRVVRAGGLAELWHALRRSFYRKQVATLLVASTVPLVGLALFLRGYVERQGAVATNRSAVQFVSSAQRQLEDYAATRGDGAENGMPPNDEILYWLRRVVGQEIHLYRDGRLQATSKPELFGSGLLTNLLPGEVQRGLSTEGLPYVVVASRLGSGTVPVAYAPVRRPGQPAGELVVAVPVIFAQREIAQAVDRAVEIILLATVALVGLLAVCAAYLARTVARPVRELLEATSRITAGDYAARLSPRTRDEVADLVHAFNGMARALADQRADLERRRDYMETLLRHATTGVLSIDTLGRIVTVNPAAAELLGSCGGGLAEGADLVAALAGAAELKPLAEALERLAGGRNGPLEVDLRCDSPRRLHVVRVALHDPDGAPSGELILLDDVTDMMRSNQLAAWAEMARAIAHEIKNPLTPIQLSAEHLARLLRDRDVLPAPEIEACLDTIVKQVRALYDIAGEFSAYAKLPALSPEATDPVALMRTVIGPYRAAAPPGVTIVEDYRAAPTVTVDRKVLSRAMINLVENALDAMPEGGRLTVGVAADAGRDEVVLSVHDTGPGLSPEVRSRLFEPYFSTKSSGTGLGLAIVRRAIEAHRGRIEVESVPTHGTAFRVCLPPRRAA